MATQGTITITDGSIKARHISENAAFPRSVMALVSNAVTCIPLTHFRVHDAIATNLPATGGSDDLGLYTNTPGTLPPFIATGDVKNLGAISRKAAALVPVPKDYEDGETLTIRLKAGMVTTVASTSATIDVSAYRLQQDGTTSADLCATSATNINSTDDTAAEFLITATDFVAGDELLLIVTIAVSDTATVTAVNGALFHAELLADVR